MKTLGVLLMCALFVFSQSEVQAQVMERSDILEKDTWNLADLYDSVDSWTAEKERIRAELDKIDAYPGTLDNAQQLLAYLNFTSGLSKEGYRLYSYASMLSDQDTRESIPLGMVQELQQLFTDFGSKTAFDEPEILVIGKDKIDEYIAATEGLKKYKMYLHDLFRRQEHKLSAPEEKIIAEAGLMSGNAGNIYSIFSNADLPYPEVELSDGEKVTITAAAYTRYRATPVREDREKVFEAFFGKLNSFRRTFGTMLDGNVKSDMFNARVRKYDSALHASLDRNNIPVAVYHALIEGVNNNLATLHRYLGLQKRMLAVDTLKYSDLYVTPVEDVDLEFTTDEAEQMVLGSMAPLGTRYTTVLEEAFDNRWIDYYPTPGKRSGAYSNGSAYDVHPYILMNFNTQYEDVSTLTHELGHSLHSYFANKTQPFATADYSIFVAEVASTFNEALLMADQLKKIKDDDIRLSLLMSYLNNARQTVFRQTQFAEFELKIHELGEKGIPLTGDKLTEVYTDIVRRYYGHDEDICQVDDRYTIEWAYIPHFYYNFYVYQYATSFTASTALSELVLAKQEGAADRYVDFLSAGGSDYPIEILKKAGVDLTTSEPLNQTMTAMNRVMDEIEKILDKKGQ